VEPLDVHVAGGQHHGVSVELRQVLTQFVDRHFVLRFVTYRD
jgi:hypothetical protein